MNRYQCEGNNDSGHIHMIRVLQHCQKWLKGCRAVMRDVRQVLKQIQQWRKNNSKVDGNHRTRRKEEQHGVDAGYDHDIYDDDQFHNRFAAFAHVFDGEEAEDTEPESDVEAIIQERKDDIDSSPVTVETDIYTIEQDLIKGSDRLQACCFLYTMETLMGLVSQHYHVLKVDVTASKCSDPKMLMQCAMVANTCMYSVQRAEAALAIDYPYIDSFYCVLAVVYLPSVLAVFEEDVLSSASEASRKKCDKAAMIKFFGDVVGCSFQNKGNMGRYYDLVQKFSMKTGVAHTEVDRIGRCAKMLTDLEIQSSFEKEFEVNKRMHNMFRENGIGKDSHQWLLAHTYIGGERSILSTLRWLQNVIHISRDETKLMSIPGFFGTLWDEERNTASSIQGDLDELFCGSILPELLEWCKTRNPPPQRRPANGYIAVSHGFMLDTISPHTQQTLPILHMLRKHMKENKDGPVPISLAFGMHCILTSIIEMQGHGDVARHASNAEKSWNALFQSLETHKMDSDIPNHDSFFANIERVNPLNALPTPVGTPSTQVSARMAFFNPLMAGSYLLFANYAIGLGLGSCTVDSIGQLRFVLHLYNAFQKTGLLYDVPLLKEADAVFKDTQAVWVLNDHPDRGEFCKRFLLAWGFSSKGATKAIEAISSGTIEMSECPQNDCRNLKPILPEEMSASYRLVMNRDFTGVVDDYSVKNYDMITPDKKKEQEVFLNTLSNINMTRDRMDDDEDSKVSFTNWTQVGCIFNEFIRALMKEFGWDQIVQQCIWKCPDNVRHGQRSDGSRTYGKFQVSDVNLEYQAYSQIIYSQILHPIDQDPNCTVGKQCAEFMKKYFAKIDEKTYSFYIDDAPHSLPSGISKSEDSPTIEELQAMSVSKLKKMAKTLQLDLSKCFEKSDVVELLAFRAICTHSNVEIDVNDPYIRGTRLPKSTLEGANPLDIDLYYPHERNGTPDAPFQAFCMYKYTKTNEARVRLVKPGKLTPIGELGECPYEYANPPQLVPLSNGKYRHVGSFSLKELRQIGWDGAMYNSTSVGTWVPLVDGYESDDSDRYEAFDQRKARRERIIGLPVEDIGKYMLVLTPSSYESGEPSLVQLKK